VQDNSYELGTVEHWLEKECCFCQVISAQFFADTKEKLIISQKGCQIVVLEPKRSRYFCFPFFSQKKKTELHILMFNKIGLSGKWYHNVHQAGVGELCLREYLSTVDNNNKAKVFYLGFSDLCLLSLVLGKS